MPASRRLIDGGYNLSLVSIALSLAHDFGPSITELLSQVRDGVTSSQLRHSGWEADVSSSDTHPVNRLSAKRIASAGLNVRGRDVRECA